MLRQLFTTIKKTVNTNINFPNKITENRIFNEEPFKSKNFWNILRGFL